LKNYELYSFAIRKENRLKMLKDVIKEDERKRRDVE